MSLLISLAGQKKSGMQPPVSSFDTKPIQTTSTSLQPANSSTVDVPLNPISINALKTELIAAMHSEFQNNHFGKRQRQFQPSIGNHGGAQG